MIALHRKKKKQDVTITAVRSDFTVVSERASGEEFAVPDCEAEGEAAVGRKRLILRAGPRACAAQVARV